MIRKISVPLLVIVLFASCNLAQKNEIPASAGTPAATQESNLQSSVMETPSETGTADEPALGLTYEPLDYCFAYPQGFTQQINENQVEVFGSQSNSNPHPGLVWIDATDPQGRSALDIAEEEVRELGGAPERSVVMLGGEEALVLDGMPGQDAIRKVYIVHNGLLYTLNFTPFQSDNEEANAQMETLFEFVTSSWIWISSGSPCPADD
jgi:hypothetical protein